MYRVQISARMIQWPDVCACCCQAADTRVEVSSTRTTGKKIIRSTTKTWNVPYCRRCLEHIDASKDLQSHSRFVLHPSLVIGVAGGLLALLVFALALTASVPLALVPGVATLVLTVAALLLTYEGFQEKYQRALAAKKAERDRLQRGLDALLSATCCAETYIAAAYQGWHGTVHSFIFSSQQFAAAFEQANPGKCLRDGQIHH
jgi:hypothetical protein